MVVCDQMDRELLLDKPPQRIISLVPSQTELLIELGLEEQLVGITKFCIHPDRVFRDKPRIGGTKQISFEKIAALQPDLIIGNKEENEEAQIRSLMEEYPVWMSDIADLSDALSMIKSIGLLTGKIEAATLLVDEIVLAFASLEKRPRSIPSLSTGYFIWADPTMAVGGSTFIDNMLAHCGLTNAFADRGRYPEVTLGELSSLEVVLLSSEPFPFAEKHLARFQELCPKAVVLLVDGELFSWYGSRLKTAPAYFSKVLGQIDGALHLK